MDTTTMDFPTQGHAATAEAQRQAPRRIARFDARDCPVSTRSQAALDHAEEAQRRMVSYIGDALVPLDAAIDADPRWALPYLMKADLLATLTEHGHAQAAMACLQAAIALADQANDRERAHMTATRLALQGRWSEACEAWERLLHDHPQDLLALQMAHLFDFARGDARNLQRRVARVLPEWSADAPLYSYVLGMHAFGLEENNLHAAALDAGHAALAIERRDAWAIHAVAHVHEMRGEHEAGSAWLRMRTGDWAPDNGLAFHNWWHLALFHLERLDSDTALAIFDQRIAPGAAMALQKLDVTAMLWRLKLLGIDGGARWDTIADAWPTAAPEAGHYAFNDLHAVMALIGAGRIGPACTVLAAVRRSAEGGSTLATMAADVGVPLIEGLIAYGGGHYTAAAERLWSARDGCHRFGGSHAQRDIVDQTLMDAAVRGGRPQLARRVLNERLQAKRGSGLTRYWERRIAG